MYIDIKRAVSRALICILISFVAFLISDRSLAQVVTSKQVSVVQNSSNNAVNVLANDSSSFQLSVASVGSASHGTASVASTGYVALYTPNAGYTGPDSFTYSVSDGHGGAATATVSVTVLAQPPAPAVFQASAPMVSPSAAITYYGSATTRTADPAWAPASSEIAALARSLGAGRAAVSQTQYAQNVYDYVRNNVATEFRFGLGKGARGALIDLSGTPFDQAELMMKLLRLGGVSATYQLGLVTLTPQQFGQWTGLVANLNQSSQSFTVSAQSACQFLADGGIPAIVNNINDSGSSSYCGSQVSGNLSTITMLHIWVQTSANNFLFDPSYKQNVLKTGVDIAAALGCGNGASPTCASQIQSAALTGASTGNLASTSIPFVQNLNEAAVSSQLTAYAKSLQSAVMGSNQFSLLQDVIGGSNPDPTYSPTATASLPYSATASTSWSGDIPDQYRTKVTYQFCGQSLALMGDNLAGRRLRRWWAQSPVSPGSSTPDFWMERLPPSIYSTYIDDADVLDCTSPYGAPASSPLTSLTVAPPYAAQGGAYGVNTYSANATRSDGIPGIALSFIVQLGESSDSSVKFMSDLQEADPSPFKGSASSPSAVTTIACNTQGGIYNSCRLDSEPTTSQRLLTQQSQAMAVVSGVAKVALRHHSRIGFQSGKGLSSFDYSFSVQSLVSNESLVGDAPNVDLELFSHVSSLLEGSISQQQNNNGEPLSGTTSFVLSNRSGVRILDVAPANMAQAIPQLSAYFSPRTTDLQALAASGYEVILPQNGYIPCYLSSNCSVWPQLLSSDYAFQSGGVALLLQERLKGGGIVQGADPIASAIAPTKKATESRLSELQGVSYSGANGAISLNPQPDLVTGSAPFPKGLQFQRFYNSGTSVREQLDSDPISGNYITGYSGPDTDSAARLGGGWGHNFQVTAQLTSNSTIATGQYRAIDASGLITGAYVDYQLLRNLNFTNRISALFTDYWVSKQLLWNTVHVKVGSKILDFTKLPDGSYNPPQGQSASLQQTGVLPSMDAWQQYDFSGVGYKFTDNDGSVISFDNSLVHYYFTNPYGDPQFKAVKWQFPDGAAVTFSYTSQTTTDANSNPAKTFYVLSKVSNNFGRYITFNTGSNSGADGTLGWPITSIVDDSGRSVSFGRSNCPTNYANYGGGIFVGNSTLACNTFSVTLPNSAVWTYSYAPGADSPDPAIITRPAYHLRRWYTPTNSTAAYEVLSYDGLYRAATNTDILGHQTSYYPGGVEGTEIWKRSDVVTPLSETSTTIFNFYDLKTATIDPLGRVTTYAYDNGKRKLQETYPGGNYLTYDVYDARSNLLQKTRHPAPGSPLSPITTYVAYGVGADASSVASPSTVLNCSNWMTCNKAASETDGRGAVTSYGWDATTGNLTQILQPADLNGNQPESDFAYTGYTGSDGSTFKLLTSKTEAIVKSNGAIIQGLTTTYAYNTANKYVLQSATADPSGKNLITGLGFDAYGDPISITDPNGNTTKFTWDAIRRLTAKIDPSAPALVSGTSQPVQLATQYVYDQDNQLTETDRGTWPSGGSFQALEKATFAYDAVGNKIQATASTAIGQAAPAALTEYSYDADNRALCATVRMSPPAYGAAYVDACTLVNAADRITKTVYDAAGQKLQERRAVGTALEEVYATFAYTPNGKQASVMDAYWASNAPAQQQGNLTCYLYDGFDRLVATEFPVTAPAAARCDPTNAELIGQLASGVNAAQGYTGAQVVGGYDANDNKLLLTKRDGTPIAHSYDALNREVLKHFPSSQGDVATSYDLMGKVLSAHYANGKGVDYAYDSAERLISETSSTATASLTLSYTLDGAGNPTQVSWPGTDGFFVGYSYDALNRVANVCERQTGSACATATTLGQGLLAAYAYDSFGRKTSLTRANGTSTSWSWDAADRLAQLNETLPNPANAYSWGFQYSAASQLIQRTLSNPSYLWPGSLATSQAKTYDGLNRDAAIAAIGDGYDKNGNLTDDGARHFAYDYENRLLCEGTSAAACQSGGTPRVQLAYDPTGRLQQVNAAGGGGANSLLLYRADKLSAEYDAANNNALLRRYVHGPGTDEPLVWYEYSSGSAVRNWLHADRQGSVIAQSNDSGAVIQSYAYGPYGEPKAWGGSRFAYTGQIQLPELQLYHYKARVYDPITGRFLQTDPVGYKADLDLYEYVGDDPIDHADPTGECPDACVMEAGVPAAVVWGGAAILVGAGLCVETCGAIKDNIEHAVSGFLNGILHNDSKPQTGPGTKPKPDPNAQDKKRTQQNRDKRNQRREDRSRGEKGNGQNKSGDGFRDRDNANKGPSGDRPSGPDRSNNRERNQGIDEEHSMKPKGQQTQPRS